MLRSATVVRMSTPAPQPRPHDAPQSAVQSVLEALARPLRQRGVEVVVGVAVGRPVSRARMRMVRRAAWELLVEAAGRAPYLVTLVLVERGGGLRLTVGHGRLGGAAGDRHERPGGERLDQLEQRLVASGGSLTLDARSGFATYTAELPVD